jgi:hypothetical protein
MLASTSAADFFDDFNDNYIGDWDPRCAAATWWAEQGWAQGSTSTTPACLTVPGSIYFDDCTVSATVMGTHAFGIVCRLTDEDTGVIAYVSPDADVARIRLIEGGTLGTILASVSGSFPDAWYELTFTCEGASLQFDISVPSTGQTWSFGATDPDPESGMTGLLMGDESHAYWDDFQVIGSGSAPAAISLSAVTVDDDSQSESTGDGDGAFEAAEQIEVHYGLYNSSSSPATNVYALLQSLSSSIVVVDNYEQYGTIQPGTTGFCLDDFVINAEPFAAMPETYPMRLTVVADGGYSHQFDFEIPLGNGLICDVETGSGYADWTGSSLLGSWGDNWHISTTRNHTSGGSRSFKCGDTSSGDYDNHLYCGEASPWFNAANNAVLTFWMWTDAQVYTADASLALDGGLLQIGQFDNWTSLVPQSGYPYEIVSGTTGPFAPGTGVYSGSYGWQLVSIPLTAAHVGPQRLRFVFGSDNAGTREGWYIDDIAVSGSTGIEPDGSSQPLAPLSASASPNPFSEVTCLQLEGDNAGQTAIVIYDLAGRIMRELTPVAGSGSWVAVWDGSDGSGGEVPAGVYVARCSNEFGEVRLVRMVRTE